MTERSLGQGTVRAGERGSSMNDLITGIAKKWDEITRRANHLGFDLPPLEPAWLKPIETKKFDMEGSDIAAIEDTALAAAEDDRGWMRFQSASFDGQSWRGDKGRRGPPLWAEWAEEDKQTSHRLTPDPQRRGGVIHFTYKESNVALNGWAGVLVQRASLRGHEGGRNLLYHVYWGAEGEDPSESRRLFARFIRFTREAD